ncbi:MAG: UDP-N-acetylmuramate dehydrogenase [Clostridiales bacterium]|jgi:UDP-N-acetylmuramate dehydrogenase|nr:UDP-N-acetylmuramate dehydrogenase [Clostridiales bacterium]MDN5282625.1 UDP-N-acetylmuramate dehydrogenase [Candidatus Ozemobacter sp.]
MKFSTELLRRNVPLRDYVTFRLGGPAELFFDATNRESFVQAINYARGNKIPCFILGGGSNLVVSDSGIDGLVVKNSCRDFSLINAEERQIVVSAGFDLGELVKIAHENSLAGAEYFTGIPGSVGGAIFGNAGAYGRSVADVLIDAEVLFPDGTIHTVPNSFFKFDYRTSVLKTTPYIVLSARFQLAPGDREEIMAKMLDIKEQRKGKHPDKSVGCAGSFFKNLPPLPGEDRRRAAGAVLEKAGAKGMSYGGASVFAKHANFIINEGKATSEDVKILAQLLKEKVLQNFGIQLTEEVLYVGR